MGERSFDAGVLDTLGGVYRLETPGVAIKRYPMCSAAQAAAEAMALLLKRDGVTGDSVRSVLCEVTPLVATSLVYPVPQTVHQAQFSMPFAIGCMLAKGRLSIADMSDDVLADPALQREMAKVTMTVSAQFADQRAATGHPEAARVQVTTNAGAVHEACVLRARGMPGRERLSDAELETKFRACTSEALASQPTDAWIDRVWRLEQLDERDVLALA